MVGFVQKKNGGSMDNHRVQCFYAIKADAEVQDKKTQAEKAKKKAQMLAEEERAEESGLVALDDTVKVPKK
jgi:predicted pyridoxine 5'-phosphate oxidase superfamily flavin-nucleotide-binding protein